MSEYIAEIGEENFADEVLKSSLPVVVDFWATWCRPCRMMAPILEKIAQDLAGIVKIAKTDVDKNKSIAHNYNIRSIPTLIFFKDGKPMGTHVGFISKEQLRTKITDVFGV